jgi:hypothetical protein
MANKVVARLMKGGMVKGTSFDVSPDKPSFHVHTADRGVVVVNLAELKALFFVKDLEGDPKYTDRQTVDSADPRSRGSREIEIKFRDGERLVGLAPAFQPGRVFFYVLPVDPKSNNIRVLVNRAATVSVTQLGQPQ